MFALLVDNLPDCDVVYSVYIVYNHVISPVPLLPAGANTENRQATEPLYAVSSQLIPDS